MYKHVTPGTRFSTATDQYGLYHQRIWNDVAAQTKAQSKKAQDSAYGNRHRVVKNIVVQTPTATSKTRSVPFVQQIFANGSVVEVRFQTLTDFHLWQERQRVYNNQH